MKINAKFRKQINDVCARYSGFKHPSEMAQFYNELKEYGIHIPMFSDNPGKSHLFFIGGEEGEVVENSRFVYSMYEPAVGEKNDYNMYFS